MQFVFLIVHLHFFDFRMPYDNSDFIVDLDLTAPDIAGGTD